MTKSKISIKVSDKGMVFLKRLITNRRKADIDESDLSYWKIIEIIEKYFKTNQDKYLELIKMEYIKNA